MTCLLQKSAKCNRLYLRKRQQHFQAGNENDVWSESRLQIYTVLESKVKIGTTGAQITIVLVMLKIGTLCVHDNSDKLNS